MLSLMNGLKRKSSTATDQEAVLLHAAEDAEAVVDKENLDREKRGRKRKSSERHHYDQATKVEIGKYAVIHGNKSTVQRFSQRLGYALSEATVRNFKPEVQKQLEGGKALEDVEFPVNKKG